MTRSFLIAPFALLLSVPLGAQPGPVADVAINLSSFRIMPAVIHLTAGTPVRLVVTNDANARHDFTAPDFFAKSSTLSGAIGGGKLDLPAHGTTSVTVVPTKGSYKAWCTHFGHRLMGMNAMIVVD